MSVPILTTVRVILFVTFMIAGRYVVRTSAITFNSWSSVGIRPASIKRCASDRRSLIVFFSVFIVHPYIKSLETGSGYSSSGSEANSSPSKSSRVLSPHQFSAMYGRYVIFSGGKFRYIQSNKLSLVFFFMASLSKAHRFSNVSVWRRRVWQRHSRTLDAVLGYKTLEPIV